MVIVDDFNRNELQRKYVDYLVGQLDFLEVRRELWSYINKEKNKYSNYSLELEISDNAPVLLDSDEFEDNSLRLKELLS